ncbi:MAG: hypothetical protein HYY93_13000 [Planctomycetes bacterium]|nr:hypothetical protein [Planctomycetota bacterium]
MLGAVDTILKNPEGLLGEIAARRMGAARALGILLVGVTGTGLFGAAVGSYVGGSQVWHAAVKMPVLFLGTLGVSLMLMHVVGAAFRTDFSLDQTVLLCLSSIAVTGVILGALAPALALFFASGPRGSYNTYLLLVLLMTAAIALGGAVSVGYLYRGLRTSARKGVQVLRTLACWLLVYHFVGGQMAWLLRPFVGDNRDVFGGFSLERNLRGNIYEGIVDTALAAIRTWGD